MPSRTPAPLRAGLLAILLCLTAAGISNGATYTWNDVSGSGNWDTSNSNWLNSSRQSVPWTNGYDAYFPSDYAGDQATIDQQGVTVQGMSFSGDSNDDFYYIASSNTTSYTLGLSAASTVISVNSYQGDPFEVDVSAVLSGAGGLTKQGDSPLELDVNNTYTGTTTVSQGALRLAATGALPGGTNATGGASNLIINGGIVELDGENFYRGLGAAVSQVQWTGSGGFAAYANNQVVNLGGGSAQLTWGSGSFVPSGQALLLGSNDSYATVNFQNPINLSGGTRTIQTAGYPGVAGGDLTGNLSGSGAGLTVTGSGILQLSGSDTFTGPTTVSGAILQLSSSAALPGGIAATGGSSELILTGGGVVDLDANNFMRSAGTGQSQVVWNGSGGFSASSGSRAVNIGGAGATLTWGSNNFVPSGSALVLGSAADDSTVVFQNPINFGGSARTVQVDAGNATIDAQLAGALTNGGLTITGSAGSGTLELTASNGYSGQTTVNGAVLRLSNSSALPGGIGVSGGSGNLLLENSGVLELNASNFSRGLGTGNGQVQWIGGGGFSAGSGTHSVNIGGAGGTLTWGGSNFVSNGQPLIFGSGSDGATVVFQNPVNLSTSGQTIQVNSGNAAVDAQMTGAISGGNAQGGLTIAGGGTIEFTASNSYLGPTYLAGGVLRVSNSAALPAASNLVLNEGQLELNSGNFTRALGSGTNEVQWQGDGGFSAAGGTRSVNIGGSGATLTWGSGSFVPAGNALLLGAKSDTATLFFLNPLNLSTNGGTIGMAHGAATVDAELTGSISDNSGDTAGLTIQGQGTLEFAVRNSYTGPTTISTASFGVPGPVLRLSNSAALPGGTAVSGGSSNLVLDGGILELAASNFNRQWGSAASQFYTTGNGGGFSASGGSRAVNLGGSSTPTQVTWAGGNFLPSGAPLMLGSPSDDSTLVFQNPINLNSTVQSIIVSHGSAAVDAVLSGNLTNGGLDISGEGVLQLTGTNTFTGGLIVGGAGLKVEIVGSAALASGNALTVGDDTAAFGSEFGPVAGADAAPATTAVPEPTTLALMGCGIAMLMCCLRRRDRLKRTVRS